MIRRVIFESIIDMMFGSLQTRTSTVSQQPHSSVVRRLSESTFIYAFLQCNLNRFDRFSNPSNETILLGPLRIFGRAEKIKENNRKKKKTRKKIMMKNGEEAMSNNEQDRHMNAMQIEELAIAQRQTPNGQM